MVQLVKFCNTSRTCRILTISVWHIVGTHSRLLLLYPKKVSEGIVTVAFHWAWVCQQKSSKGGNTYTEQRGINMRIEMEGRLRGTRWPLGSQRLKLESQQSKLFFSLPFPHLFLSLFEFILSSKRQTFPHIREHSQQHPQDFLLLATCPERQGVLSPSPSYKIPRGVLWPSVGPFSELATVTRGKGYHDWPTPLPFREVGIVNQTNGIKRGSVIEKPRPQPNIATTIDFSSFNLPYFSVIFTTRICIHLSFWLFVFCLPN